MELMRSYAASPTEILVKTRIPNALPYLFTALKIAAPVAVITAFVAEYFGGSQNGLGYGITSNAAASRTAASWAYVVGACVARARLLPHRRRARASRLARPRHVLHTATPNSPTNQQARGLTPGGATA